MKLGVHTEYCVLTDIQMMRMTGHIFNPTAVYIATAVHASMLQINWLAFLYVAPMIASLIRRFADGRQIGTCVEHDSVTSKSGDAYNTATKMQMITVLERLDAESHKVVLASVVDFSWLLSVDWPSNN